MTQIYEHYPIIASLLSLALLVSAISGITVLLSGKSDLAPAVLFPFAAAWIGFVMFGIVGSVFWLGFFAALRNVALAPMKRHFIAASLSMLATLVAATLLGSRGEFGAVLGDAFLLVFLAPVVAVSLLWYQFLYAKQKLNNANHGDR